jgi:hypothetical protein
MNGYELEELESDRNRRAYLAIQGLSEDWAADLIFLLRSKEPIDRLVRDALADAIDPKSKSPVRFTMQGQKPFRDAVRSITRRREWMTIGEWIDARIGAGASRTDAIIAASQEFYASIEKCDKALDYYRRCRDWLSLRDNDERMADVFHALDRNKVADSD